MWEMDGLRGDGDTLSPNLEGTGRWMDLAYGIHPCVGVGSSWQDLSPFHDLLCLSPKSPPLLPWQSDATAPQGPEHLVTTPLMRKEEAKLVRGSLWQWIEPHNPLLGSPEGGLGPKVPGVGAGW